MLKKFSLLMVLATSLLLLPVLVSSAQSDRASDKTALEADASYDPRVRGDVVGTLLIKAETNESELADAIEVIDYGQFQWAIFPNGTRLPSGAETTSFALSLGNSTIDTSVSAQTDAAAPAAEGKDLHLVQMIGPVKSSWQKAIAESGLEIVQYIYPFTYVVYGEVDVVEGLVDSAEFIRYHGPFETDFRFLPNLQSEINRSNQAAEYRIVIYRGANSTTIANQLQALTGVSTQFSNLNSTWAAANISLNSNTAKQAAELAGVFSIQPIPTDGGHRGELSNQIIARNFDALGQLQVGYADWLATVGFDGSGVIVADVDGGVQDNHPDLVNNMLPCTGSTCGGSAIDSHGTHTAGIIAADGSSGQMLNGFLRGQGVAPSANLIEQVYSPTFTFPDGMLTLMQDSVRNDVVISANSWGPAGSPRGYDNDTMQVDIGARDADADAAGNQPLTYVLSFMNGGGGTMTQGSPDEAKNIFTIGSSNAQSGSGLQSNDLFSLSANSAHGPARDGRIIPHMIAPGCLVDSTNTTNSYGFKCGTSMASPHVSGGAALFFEKYRMLNEGNDPSPALVKAAFTVISDSMAGNDDADDNTLGQPFDSKQGWGLFNLTEVISPTYPTFYIDQTELFTATGQSHDLTITAAVADKPVRIMLTWTDAPGHGLGGTTPAWNNNLDLVATFDGATYSANQFDANGWSTPSAVLDNRNNTEALFFESVGAGKQIALQIAANDINSDGVPSNAHDMDQDFALACYNCLVVTAAEPSFVDLSLSKSYSSTMPLNSPLDQGVGAGVVVDFTISRTVVVSGSFSMVSSLIDASVPGLDVISDTIRINGQLRSNAFDISSGSIIITDTIETINDVATMTLTYQALVTADVPVGATITNSVTTEVQIGSTVKQAEATTAFKRLLRLFAPVIMQDSP